jgi:tellurite resistance protein TehA-like permease
VTYAVGAVVPQGRLAGWLDDGVRSLYPGYFALVMATGLVSNGFYYVGFDGLAVALLIVNAVAFPLLLVATAARAVRHPRALWTDLVDPRLVFSFFTLVAGADVLGLQLFLHGFPTLAVILWVAALAAWLVLSYFSFSVLTFINTETGADIVHGGWLIAIVGTESLALLGARVAPHLGSLQSQGVVGVEPQWGQGLVL